MITFMELSSLVLGGCMAVGAANRSVRPWRNARLAVANPCVTVHFMRGHGKKWCNVLVHHDAQTTPREYLGSHNRSVQQLMA
jgi:hypothetical protein